MKSTIGKNISFSLFGESHGEMIGVVIDGLAPGIKLDLEYINQQMDMRKAKGKISTQRQEDDQFQIVSGYFNSHTTGTPLTILIPNKKQHSKDYSKTKSIARPSHADYSAEVKYKGFQDYRGGGHFSGRLTAPLVAAGSICKQILESKGVYIASHIASLKGIKDIRFQQVEDLEEVITKLNSLYLAVIDEKVEKEMKELIESTAKDMDSVGGTLESIVYGLDAGYGEPYFHSIESMISHLLFSMGGVKGIEFGLGFDFENHFGSEINDSFYMDGDQVKTQTNNNGGINGGISNGMPIILRTVIKPTPSIFKPQQTVNFHTLEDVNYQIKGRHDPAIIHRARVVQDSLIAIAVLDLMIERHGNEWMAINK